MLMPTLEMEAATIESVSIGNSIGELGFIEGSQQMSTVTCLLEGLRIAPMNKVLTLPTQMELWWSITKKLSTECLSPIGMKISPSYIST
jgi:hypothetical protein